MLNLFYLLETPKGRTLTICVLDKQNAADRRSEFDAIVRSISLPR
jgi:hypothetical protein